MSRDDTVIYTKETLPIELRRSTWMAGCVTTRKHHRARKGVGIFEVQPIQGELVRRRYPGAYEALWDRLRELASEWKHRGFAATWSQRPDELTDAGAIASSWMPREFKGARDGSVRFWYGCAQRVGESVKHWHVMGAWDGRFWTLHRVRVKSPID